MPLAASSVGVGRRAKRENALVSSNDLDARHSGDGVILLVGLRSRDAHLSVTFISDKQRTLKLCCNICPLRCYYYVGDFCRSILNFDLATLLLVFLLFICFQRPVVLGGLYFRV